MKRASRDAIAPLWIACLVLVAIALSRSGLDIAFARIAYDPASTGFPWRSHSVVVHLLHDGAKTLTVALELALLAAVALTYFLPTSSLRPYREAFAYLAVASLASALAVALLKSQSAHSCPWDLAIFGGRYEYFPLLGAVPPNAGPGRCAPSGHASVGFMWIAAVYAHGRLPRSMASRVDAALLACAVGALGVVAAVTQLLRGAHFLSHVVLTAAVCWAVAWLASLAWPSAVPRGVASS